ncbi:MAG: sialidase family protein [Planctomycetota bacterium]
MRQIPAALVILGCALYAAGAANTDEKVKLLAGFEPEQVATWGFKDFKEKDGVYPFALGGALRKGDVSQGEWALVYPVKAGIGPETEQWQRYYQGTIFCVQGQISERNPWRAGQKTWFSGDWSGYARLRMDLKSTKSAARVRVQLYDEIAAPPVIRFFDVPAGEWVTLDCDLAGASKLHEMKLSAETAKAVGAPVAKVRLFNPARMAAMLVVIEHSEAATEFILDNIRLAADEKAEESRYKMVTDPRPFREPMELPPSEPKARDLSKVKADSSPIEKGDPILVPIKHNNCYGRISEMVHHAITAVDKDRIVLAESCYWPVRTLDGGKTWEAICGNVQHSGHAPGVGVAASGPDLLGVYSPRCPCGGRPSEMFFSKMEFDGRDWVADGPHLVDIDSWHCPEFRIEVFRLKSGRIWAAWGRADRFASYHRVVVAHYSDDGGKTWRAPDSNGLAIVEDTTHWKTPLPIGVTWWWEGPNLTPALEKSNGRIGACEPHPNPALVPYGDQIACTYGSSNKGLVWSRFDGKAWSTPELVARGYGQASAAATLGDKEVHVVFGGKVYVLADGKWVENSPAEKGADKVVVSGNVIMCIGMKAAEAEGKRVTELWVSRRTSGGTWSNPEVVAREETPAGKGIRLMAPQYAPENFVPVAWAPVSDEWIKVLRIPVEQPKN